MKSHLVAIIMTTLLAGCATKMPAENTVLPSLNNDPISTQSVEKKDDTVKNKVEKKATKKLALKSMIEQTLNTNPTVQIASARENEARIAVEVEKTSKKPTVDLSVSSGFENVYTESETTKNVNRSEANLSVNQTLYSFGKIKSSVERRDALYKSAKLNYKNTSEKIIFDVIKSYINYLRQSELVSLAHENVKSHQKISKLIKLQEEGGNATKADEKRVATRLDSANSNKLENERRFKDAANKFRRLTDLEPQSVIKPKRLVSLTLKAKDSDANNVNTNPKLRSILAERDALEKELKSNRAKRLPELFALGEANLKNNVSGETGFVGDFRGMIGFRVRLFDGGNNSLKSEQIQSRILETEANHRKLHNELKENYKQSIETISTNREKVAFLQESVNSANEVIKLYNEQFETGSRKPLELLDAQRDLHAAKQELINHKYDSSISVYKAKQISGSLIEYFLN